MQFTGIAPTGFYFTYLNCCQAVKADVRTVIDITNQIIIELNTGSESWCVAAMFIFRASLFFYRCFSDINEFRYIIFATPII